MAITVSVSEAKKHLGNFADRVLAGEDIVIVRKSKLLKLVQIDLPTPVPMRPAGYFEDCYDAAEAEEDAQLAACSIQSRVK